MSDASTRASRLDQPPIEVILAMYVVLGRATSSWQDEDRLTTSRVEARARQELFMRGLLEGQMQMNFVRPDHRHRCRATVQCSGLANKLDIVRAVAPYDPPWFLHKEGTGRAVNIDTARARARITDVGEGALVRVQASATRQTAASLLRAMRSLLTRYPRRAASVRVCQFRRVKPDLKVVQQPTSTAKQPKMAPPPPPPPPPPAPQGALKGYAQDQARDGIYPPRTVVHGGVKHDCELTVRELSLLAVLLPNVETAFVDVFNRKNGVWRELYSQPEAQRNKLSRLLNRLNRKLASAKPPLRICFSIRKGQDFISREVFTSTNPTAVSDKSMTNQ